MVAARPTHSTATSAPCPPVSLRISRGGGVGGDDVVGGAGRAGELLLLRGDIDGDDLRGAGDPGGLEHGQADAADAEDDDRLAGPDPGAVVDGAVSGEDRAAEQGGVGRAGCRPGRAVRSSPRRPSPRRTRRRSGRGGVRCRRRVRAWTLPAPVSASAHSQTSPIPQWWQLPQEGAQLSTTPSPGATWVTPSPTERTVPAPSWPRTAGTGTRMVPSDRDRSEWQTPAAARRILTWPGPGSGSSMSVTSRGAPTAGSTAARTTDRLLADRGARGRFRTGGTWSGGTRPRPCGPSSRPTPDCL